jgi:hypothetical protein
MEDVCFPLYYGKVIALTKWLLFLDEASVG